MDDADDEKYHELMKYSNPYKVLKNLEKYLGYKVRVFLSTRKSKKYMIKKQDDTWVHFGQMGYEDYTYHCDDVRRIHYIQRASNIKGDWERDKYSPNNLSIHGLWM
jgi:hypothetical protein